MTDINAIRHTLAHLLAHAAQDVFPGVQFGVGPTTEHGFYYDLDFTAAEGSFSQEDLPRLEERMRELSRQELTMSSETVSRQEAKERFANQPYKLEIIESIAEEEVSIYTIGDFTDICRGGHVHNTSEITPDAFRLTSVAGAYWRGDERNTMLTRIYGVAFHTQEELTDYLEWLEEARRRDHRTLGKQLGLFTFSETVGKGLPLWTAKGATLRRTLERFIVDEELRRGYEHVYTPDIAKIDLYQKSGHYPYYKDAMYAPVEIDDEQFILRPMSCPHHFELYQSEKRSYRELPKRIAELAKLYRYEQSGELSGLTRVRAFCLADAHIICADDEQVQEEISGALDLIDYVADALGLVLDEDYWYRLSLGDRSNTEKYYKDDAAWDTAEEGLRNVLQARTADFVEASDEAAFYGPKIDIQMRNVFGKEETAFTVQYDFVMPKRFNLVYTAKDGTEQQPIVVHRSSIGAIERIIAFLIEHYGGAFPVWLAPEQVRVLPISGGHLSYARQVAEQLEHNGVRVTVDDSDETIGKKIRNGETRKIPYLLIVGDDEASNETVSVRSRTEGDTGNVVLTSFIERIQPEVRRTYSQSG